MKKKGAVNTFIGTGVKLEGDLNFEGTIRIDGEVRGTITSKDGMLVVGEKALVEGDIRVGKVVISGTVRGGIEASDCVEIQKSGQMVGDIESPVVTIDSGAVFHGNCAMREKGAKSGKKAVNLTQKQTPLTGTGL